MVAISNLTSEYPQSQDHNSMMKKSSYPLLPMMIITQQMNILSLTMLQDHRSKISKWRSRSNPRQSSFASEKCAARDSLASKAPASIVKSPWETALCSKA